MIVACPLVDGPENRRWIRETFGADPTKVPWLNPYAGSVKGTCAKHGGPIWIGPQSQTALATGAATEAICLICAGAMSHEITIVSLSKKTTTTYGGEI